MPDLSGFATWLVTVLLYIPQKVYELITDVLVSGIDGIFALCTACDLANLNSALATIPLGVLWILSWFKIGTGLTIVFGAYSVRFLIRRLPVIG